RALAARRAPVHVVGVMALAENMPGGDALRPGDVLRSYAGRTVEVIDTDAEGRLVLADALAWAAAELRPAALIDLATLTGAMITTLGRHRAGLFANDDSLAGRLLRLGEAEGEGLWRLPLSRAADEALKSPIADLRNCSWSGPDALHAARFLEGFVPEGMPWAHLDIAGVADSPEDLPLSPKGPTGFGVRLLDALADEFPA
ncbi:MAG: leucyl aminopeptidase, partial [Alphaproteobacteria bacterium]|nr:leucyl aminopeptidase [Alphaproteobacteria bacterium]